MNTHPQYWQARTSLRVRVLGMGFLILVLVMLGLLWLHWGQNIWLYSGVVSSVLVCTVYALGVKHTTALQRLAFDESSSEFSLLSDSNTLVAIHILRVWQSAFAITIQVQIKHNSQIKQLTFWRGTLAASCWRKLQIHLWRYQLQYQFSDLN